MAIGPFDVEMLDIPRVSITDYLPDVVRAERRSPILPNQPRAATSLVNKYAPGGLFDQLAQSGQYADHALNAIRAYDEDRVQRGQAPLTEEQTQKSLQAATNRQQVTPEPKRGLFNVFGNAIKDAGDILKSIPQIPGALIAEGKAIGNIGEAMQEGPNPIAGLLNAPGVRMLPGAFIAGNIASGTPGELLRHPLFSALDILPVANKAAAGTKVAQRAAELADIAKASPDGTLTRPLMMAERQARRPISTALANTVDAEGNIVRNPVGEMVDKIRDTRGGQKLAEYFGRDSRDAVFILNASQQRVRSIIGGEIDVPDNAIVPLARRAVEFDNVLKETGVDTVELYDRMQVGNYADANPAMLDAMEQARALQADMATYLQEENLAIKFDGELYDLPTGVRLRETERRVGRTQTLADMRRDVEASAVSGTLDPKVAIQRTLDAFRRPRFQGQAPGVTPTPGQRIGMLDNISGKDLTLYHNSMVRSLENMGYDTAPLREAWQMMEGRAQKYKTLKDGKVVKTGKSYPKDPAQYELKLQEILADPDKALAKRNMASVDDAIKYLKDNIRDPKIGPGAKMILAAIADGSASPTVVTKGIELLRRTDAWANEPVINRLKAIRETQRFIKNSKLGDVDAKALAKERAALDTLVNESVPARFLPELQRQTKVKATEKAIAVNTVEQAEEIVRMADNGLWADIPNFTDKMYRQAQREAAMGWKQWRDAGFDPIFVHSVTPNRVFSAVMPKTGVVPNSISSVKKRSWDMAPSVKNVGLSMTDQMREILSREHTELAVKQIMDQMGESELSLRRRFADAARNRAATNTALDFEGHLQNIINEKFTRFDPDLEGYFWGSPYLKKLKQDRMFIPKHVAKNLKGLAEPKRLLGGVLDPVTNTFRAATTSLSLRTQLYNIVGNFIATEIQNPGATLRSWSQAREWRANPEMIPPRLREVLGSAKNTFMELDREAMGVVNEGAWGYLRGKTLGRLWDGEQAAKTPGKAITKYGDKFKGLVEKSYDLNGKVDDMFRMVNYIDGYNSAVKKGASAAGAERRAISAVRSNLQDWMSMTPIERSVIRSIIPFYGYMGHAMRFVLRYPFDHPLRTEMMTKLAEAELEDQDYLPSRFMSMLFMGGVGPQGEQGALNVGPFNPFGEIANFTTVQGILGATNPVIQTLLQQAGIQDGTAELYPSLRYDPVTGRLAARSGNPLTNLLHNTLPQSSVITAMLGVNEEFNDMVRRDPAAANRYLASGLTIPMMWREIQVDQEITKAEMARIAAQDKVKNEALKSGNWQEALQYPTLREYLRALEQLPEEQRAAFNPLTSEQIAAITNQDASVEIPQFASVTPLDDQIAQLMQSSNPLVRANATGQPIPNSSLSNTTGGT